MQERANLVVSTGWLYLCDRHCAYHNVIRASNFACTLLKTGLVIEVDAMMAVQQRSTRRYLNREYNAIAELAGGIASETSTERETCLSRCCAQPCWSRCAANTSTLHPWTWASKAHHIQITLRIIILSWVAPARTAFTLLVSVACVSVYYHTGWKICITSSISEGGHWCCCRVGKEWSKPEPAG